MQFVRLFFLTYLLISSSLVLGHTCGSKHDSAAVNIKVLTDIIELFRLDENRYPTTEEGLAALVEEKWGKAGEEKYAYLKMNEPDPWGNQYHYRFPGINNPDSFDLWTYGADGKPGGEGKDADCGNWQGSDCYRGHYKEPYEDLKFTIRLTVLVLLTPIFWLPVYLVFSVRNLIKQQPRKAAFSGWHQWVLIASFAITLVLLVLPFKSGC